MKYKCTVTYEQTCTTVHVLQITIFIIYIYLKILNFFQHHNINTLEKKNLVRRQLGDVLKRMPQIEKRKIFQVERIMEGGTTRTA